MASSYLKDINKIYCQGTKGAYSHQASRKLFPDIEPIFVKTFEQVFEMVQKEDFYAGIIPLENSTAGAVSEVFNLLVSYNLNIIAATNLKIEHNLCAIDGTKINDIKKIYSHHQALMQCSKYLSNLNSEQVETTNTAASAQLAKQEGFGVAAVCSADAANIYGLDVLQHNICNNLNNETKFIVVSSKNFIDKDADITSIYFKLENKSGFLFNALKKIKDYSINMTAIHSLPLRDEIWHYGFYCELEGSYNDKNIYKCIDSLKKSLKSVKVLGSYKYI